MNKIRQYFNTLEITKGFFIALLASLFIYLNHWGFSYPIFITIFALASLFLLLQAKKETWFWYGIFIGVFWFWWIALSLNHYGYAWGFPVGIVIISLMYGIIFYTLAWLSEKVETHFKIHSVLLKALALFGFSYLHPFGFDWLKPELMFLESYLGIEKWQFGLILLSILLSIWKNNLIFLLLIFIAYQPSTPVSQTIDPNIQLVSTQVTVEDKWNETLHQEQFNTIFKAIEQIGNKKGGEDNALFRKTSYLLNDGFTFAFFLETSFELRESIVHLGADRSSFKMTREALGDSDLDLNYTDPKGYLVLLSDSYIGIHIDNECCTHAITSELSFKHLMNKKGEFNTSKAVYFYERGSIFLGQTQKLIDELNNANLQQIGYNKYSQGEQ